MRILLGLSCLIALTLSAPAADVSDLTKKLSSTDNEVRRAAAKDLSELGKDAKPAIASLTKALKDSDRFVRRFAALALGNVGVDAKSAVPALTALLNDDSPPVRGAAVQALARMGPTAVPALNKALEGTSDVQELAITALGAAGAAGLPGLIRAIGNDKTDASLRRKAVELVVPQGKAARGAIGTLTQVVKKSRAGGQEGRLLRVDAIGALGRLATGGDKEVVSMLDEMVKDEKLRDNQVKGAAKKALSAIQKRK